MRKLETRNQKLGIRRNLVTDKQSLFPISYFLISNIWVQPVYILCSTICQSARLYLVQLQRTAHQVYKFLGFTPIFHPVYRGFSSASRHPLPDIDSYFSPLSTALIMTITQVKKNNSLIRYGG
jgi:hypothetical protein